MFWSGTHTALKFDVSPVGRSLRAAGDPVRPRPTPVDLIPRADGEGDVAIIELVGFISHKWSYLAGVSLRSWRRAFRELVSDEQISGIVIDAASAGGGPFDVLEVGREIFAARDVKPVVAVLSGTTAGAGYELASAAGEVVIAPSAMIGGIGYAQTHVDVTGRDAQRGLNVSFITAGRYKAERSPHLKLSKEARDEMLRQVTALDAAQFRAIGRNRMVHPRAVRQRFGDGRLFGAKEAVERGMADRIGTLDAEIERLRTSPIGDRRDVPIGGRLAACRANLEEHKRTIARDRIAERWTELRRLTREKPRPSQKAAVKKSIAQRRAELRAIMARDGRIPGVWVEGYAAVYGKLSGRKRGGSYSRIYRGAFGPALARSGEIVARWHSHDTGPMFARTSDGTLTLTETADGLWFSASLPDDHRGRAILRDIRRWGMKVSVGYSKHSVRRFRDGNDRPICETVRIGRIDDITLTRSPMYPQTFCRVRPGR